MNSTMGGSQYNGTSMPMPHGQGQGNWSQPNDLTQRMAQIKLAQEVRFNQNMFIFKYSDDEKIT